MNCCRLPLLALIKKAYAFKGKVESVDEKAKMQIVANEVSVTSVSLEKMP